MTTYLCTDGHGDTIEITADNAHAAAVEYVLDGDWGERDHTMWVSVRVWPADEPDAAGWHKIVIEPDVPQCAEGNYDAHEWQSPHSLLGGLTENPGVWGHGGGVIITEVCAHCGAYRTTDTWAQDTSDGEQGLESIEYRPADDDSLAWIRRRAARPAMLALVAERDRAELETAIREWAGDEDDLEVLIEEDGDVRIEARPAGHEWLSADELANLVDYLAESSA